MRKRIVIGVALLVGFLWLGWELTRPSLPDPLVRGRPLSRWLADLQPPRRGMEAEPPEVWAAIQEAGERGIPRYLALLEARDGVYNRGLGFWIWRRIPPLSRFLTSRGMTLYNRAQAEGLWGFQALGSNAAPAVPALVALMNRRAVDTQSKPAFAAAVALAYIGPAGVDALTNAMTAENPRIRECAVHGLNYVDGHGPSILSAALSALRDPEPEVRRRAALALVRFADRLRAGSTDGQFPDKDRFEAAFLSLLKDASPEVRRTAALSLREFPSPGVAQALRDAAKDPDDLVRANATESLRTAQPRR